MALPGVQVIFGFLLTVPFAQRFARIDGDQRAAYVLTLVLLTLASLLLIVPAAQHRVLFRQQDKEQLLERSNRYARSGLLILLLALTLGVFFVLHVVISGPAAVAVAGVTALPGIWWWIVLPMRHRGEAPHELAER